VAGVGKTTLINAILRIHGGQEATILLLRLPTAGAAKRMRNHRARGQNHPRLLEFDPAARVQAQGRAAAWSCDSVVVDETSMHDTMVRRFGATFSPSGRSLRLGRRRRSPIAPAGEGDVVINAALGSKARVQFAPPI